MRVCFTGCTVPAFRDSVPIDGWNPVFPMYCRNGSFIRHTSKLKPKYCQCRHRYVVESPGRCLRGKHLVPVLPPEHDNRRGMHVCLHRKLSCSAEVVATSATRAVTIENVVILWATASFYTASKRTRFQPETAL